MAENSYTDKFTIRAYETRPDGFAKMPTLCNYLQEAASNHAKELDWNFNATKDSERMWILQRLTVKIETYPRWRDTITIETWPQSGDTIRAFRDFRIISHRGDVLGKAVSQWIILDKKTHKPVRIPADILALSDDESSHIMSVPEKRIPNFTNCERAAELTVTYLDLDLNKHANNVKYIEWLLASIPNDILITNRPTEIDIEYKGECNAGDKLESRFKSTEYTPSNHCVVYEHQMNKLPNKRPLASARITLTHI